MRNCVLALLLLAAFAPGGAAQAQTPRAGDARPAPGMTDPVWLTAHGKKFHRPGCRLIQGPHDVIHSLTRAEASRRGFKPCKICKP